MIRDSKKNTVNVFWLIPQYIVITVAEVNLELAWASLNFYL